MNRTPDFPFLTEFPLYCCVVLHSIRSPRKPLNNNNTLGFQENRDICEHLVILVAERNTTMNPAAALSRSASGKHLSFRSNLHGMNNHLSAPAAARRGARRSSDSLSFGSHRYADDSESNCILSEGQSGFDYAKERLEKRQMFLRSYHFTTEAKAEATSNSSSTLSQKGRACFFKVRTALWTVIACNTARAGFVRIHRHANASSPE